MIVYSYRLAPPEDDAERERVFEQFRCAQRYRNTLVEIERGRRAYEREMLSRFAPSLATLASVVSEAEAECERLAVAIKRERGKSRKRSEPDAAKAALKSARTTAKAARSALFAERRRVAEDPRLCALRDQLSERALGLSRNARAYSGLAKRGPHFGAFGTYQLVEVAARTSFAKTPIYGRDGVTPQDPHFVPWTAEGSVSVQVQGGMTVDQALDGVHRQLKIAPPDARSWQPAGERTIGRAERDRLGRQAHVSLCLGTDVDGAPVYVTCRMHMHRALPAGAIIKRATIERVRVGHYGARWTLLLTIDAPARALPPVPTIGGAVAVDIGWRVMGDELRVAGWADDRGNTGELRLDAETIRRLREPEEKRSARDSCREMMQLRVAAWLSRATNLPDWLRDEARYFSAWRAPFKLMRLLRTWSERRFSGDEIAYSDLEAWAGNERWMHTQESDWRTRAIARRTDLYRNFGVMLVRKYDAVVIEDFDLRRLAKRPSVEADAENETARSNRQLACVHGLRDAIVQAAGNWYRMLDAMPAADTTRTCPSCGLVEDRDAAASVQLTCECGHAWDQDRTGAPVVLLARWRERPGDAKIMGGARKAGKNSDSSEKNETARERTKRKRTEKLARMEAARQAGWIDAE